MSEKLALLYARVSTNRQADTGHSLDSQSALLMREAESQGYRVEVILENSSGRKTNRPQLNEALDRLNRGEAQALFALDIDRLARSAIHALEIAAQARKRGWRLVISSWEIDTENPNSKLMLGLLAHFAEFESDLISQRVKRQHQARRERGVTWGVDQGYKGNLDPKARELVVRSREAGKSLREIVRALESKGYSTPRGGKWQPGTIRAILESPQSKALAKG